MNYPIDNVRRAVNKAVKRIVIKEGMQTMRIIPSNYKRHYILRMRDKFGTDHLYYVLYKRELFLSFGKIFDTEGPGETINLGILKSLTHRNIEKLFFVYPSGNIYSITPEEFIGIAKENQYIRMTKGGEMTAHIPVKSLEPFKD